MQESVAGIQQQDVMLRGAGSYGGMMKSRRLMSVPRIRVRRCIGHGAGDSGASLAWFRRARHGHSHILASPAGQIPGNSQSATDGFERRQRVVTHWNLAVYSWAAKAVSPRSESRRQFECRASLGRRRCAFVDGQHYSIPRRVSVDCGRPGHGGVRRELGIGVELGTERQGAVSWCVSGSSIRI
jgi:hypothetical protein